MTKLYIVATPIGNLEDVTFRAVRILGEVDLILCEDTRVTKKLLQKYNINKPTLSYHQHSKLSKTEKIFDLIEEGKDIALVSDAGTPTISDPGSKLISQIREEFGTPGSKSFEIIPIPGANALTTALSVSGLEADKFVFLGFLPHKKGRQTLFKEIAESKRVVVFYESPYRIIKTLNSLNQYIPGKKIVIARELTKIYEEIVFGTAEELLEYFETNPDKIKGEFVVMVDKLN